MAAAAVELPDSNGREMDRLSIITATKLEDVPTTNGEAATVATKGDRKSWNPPTHPVEKMQGAFEESMVEMTEEPPTRMSKLLNEKVDSATRRRILLEQETHEETHAARWRPKQGERYHTLWKLMAQIAFGVHLLHKHLAKSEDDVLTILQTHVTEVDAFLEKTTDDFELAIPDVKERVNCLKIPLENFEVFDKMLDNRDFRLSIVQGNEKIEHIITRTRIAMLDALKDVKQGLQATKELVKYLALLNPAWPNRTDDQQAIYAAMTGNAEGWFRCFVNLQHKGLELQTVLHRLASLVDELQKLAGAASRRNIGTLHSPSSIMSDASLPMQMKRASSSSVPLHPGVPEKSKRRGKGSSLPTINVAVGIQTPQKSNHHHHKRTKSTSSHDTQSKHHGESRKGRHHSHRRASSDRLHTSRHHTRSSSQPTPSRTRSASTSSQGYSQTSNSGKETPVQATKINEQVKDTGDDVKTPAIATHIVTEDVGESDISPRGSFYDATPDESEKLEESTAPPKVSRPLSIVSPMAASAAMMSPRPRRRRDGKKNSERPSEVSSISVSEISSLRGTRSPSPLSFEMSPKIISPKASFGGRPLSTVQSTRGKSPQPTIPPKSESRALSPRPDEAETDTDVEKTKDLEKSDTLLERPMLSHIPSDSAYASASSTSRAASPLKKEGGIYSPTRGGSEHVNATATHLIPPPAERLLGVSTPTPAPSAKGVHMKRNPATFIRGRIRQVLFWVRGFRPGGPRAESANSAPDQANGGVRASRVSQASDFPSRNSGRFSSARRWSSRRMSMWPRVTRRVSDLSALRSVLSRRRQSSKQSGGRVVAEFDAEGEDAERKRHPWS